MDSKKLSEIEEQELRQRIRELMLEPDIQEHDMLVARPQDWKDEVAGLRAKMTQLLKNLENDNYTEGLEDIDHVMLKLKSWKRRIQNFLT